MSQRRKLTPDEKKKVSEYARKIDEGKFPGKKIVINLDDEIDENGKVHWNTVAFDEVELKAIPNA
jgi:hypothetical protein